MPEDDITHPILISPGISQKAAGPEQGPSPEGHIPSYGCAPSLRDYARAALARTHKGGPQEDRQSSLQVTMQREGNLRRLRQYVGRDGMAEADKLMLDFAGFF